MGICIYCISFKGFNFSILQWQNYKFVAYGYVADFLRMLIPDGN
jgi:hypothetical protein